MRITLTLAAFTIAAFLPITSHAEAGEAGDAGAIGVSDAGAPAEAQGGSTGGTAGSSGAAGSAGKGGSSGAAPAPGPGPSLPDPGTEEPSACTIAGPQRQLGIFGTTLAFGAVVLTLRRRRAR